jgi:thiamine-phosphate diphosphorylase
LASASPESGAAALPRLHLVTDDRVVERSGFAALSERLLDAGGTRLALHLRARLPAGRLHPLAARLAERARAAGALLLVNERVDVALAAGAHGAQLGGGAMRPGDARRVLRPGAVIGASVHSAAEAASAAVQGADFLLAGTLYASGSHPGAPGRGTVWLREVVAAAGGAAVIGIGGVTGARVGEVLGAGAHGVAVIRAVWDAADPLEALGGLLVRLERTLALNG